MTTDNRTNVQIVADALRSMPEAERDDDRDPAVVVAEYAVAALVAAQRAAPQQIGRLDLARHYWRSQGYDYDLHGLDGNNDYEMGMAVADAALAALAAAQGAAPQAECDCGAGPGSAVCKKVCATRAPVLPSSTAPQAEAYVHCCNHPKCPGGSLCCCASEQRLRDCWNQWREEVAGDTKQAFRAGYQAGQNDPAPWHAPALPSSGVDEDALAEVLSEHVLGEPNGGIASWAWVNCSCGHRIEIAGGTREHVVVLGRKHQARYLAEWLKGQER